MMHRFGLMAFAWMVGLAVSTCLAVRVARAQSESGEKIYQRTLKGTVWVIASRGNGRAASGTGSLIDKAKKLVLTNYHVVGDSTTVRVFFAQLNNGKPIAERSHYLANPSSAIKGKVLHVDTRRDLAVIELEKVPPGAQVIHLAREGAGPAQAVHNIGNPGRSDLLWEYTSGTVRGVGQKKWRVREGSTIHEFEAKVVETQSPTNPGDSGGPLVNGRGELVGITQGMAVDAQLLSLFIDVSEVKAFLASKKLLPRLGTAVAAAGPEAKTRHEKESDGDADKAEQAAASKLRLAKTLADDGKLEKAKERYEAIIASYPDTKAAAEAKVLLERLKQ
jgi:S1-C subfamily serine protease